MSKNSIINNILRDIPLETRLKVSNEMFLITFLTEIGFREDKAWSDEEQELLDLICVLANKLTKQQLDEIERWKKDGEPK